ncbi:hypothetical protein E5288_WYG007016 [Bos mutus]|uniref:Uncharacterized protein n=1 Tax=Bos mutus TaxID=72004 RepID=A0A6B0QWU5_9CETA|nr:hypothetical protein [Bos mutus]
MDSAKGPSESRGGGLGPGATAWRLEQTFWPFAGRGTRTLCLFTTPPSALPGDIETPARFGRRDVCNCTLGSQPILSGPPPSGAAKLSVLKVFEELRFPEPCSAPKRDEKEYPALLFSSYP